MSTKGLETSSPLHEAVREELRKRIHAGDYPPGEAIPSTTMLSSEFDVSPITVKRAVRDLQSAGVLTSVPGKGTFVKEQRRFLRDLDVWMSSMDNARTLGFAPSMELVSITKEKVTDPTLSVFNPPGEAMLCVRKTIFADNTPIMYDATYVSMDMDPSIVDEFSERFVSDALRRHEINISETRLVIDAAPASAGAQRAFSIPNGYPMLRRLYQLNTTMPHLNVFGVVESPFDRLACAITLPPTSGSNAGENQR